MNHVMIDLETLGTAPGCAVLTLGAVRFDPEVDDFAGLTPDQILALPPERAFYARIERESCAFAGLAEDPETLAWWSHQSPEARIEAFNAGLRFTIVDGLTRFAEWCRAIGPDVTPWSHGAVFDIAQAEHLFRRFAIPCPWDFRNVRDTRTLYAFAGVKPERDANHHHALFDAVAQARAVIAAHRNRAAASEIAESLREEMKKIALAIGRSKTDGETDCDWAFLGEQVAEVVERAEKAEAERDCAQSMADKHYRMWLSERDDRLAAQTRVDALEGVRKEGLAFVETVRIAYQNPDITHRDFRVKVARCAEDCGAAMTAALSAPPAPATCNDPLQVGAVKESLTTADQQKVAAALKWSAENKPGHGLHDVPGVGLVHFNDGSDPTPETLARQERDERLGDEPECCIACDKPFKDGDLYYPDKDGGAIHAECCGPERESYTNTDGEPLGPNDPFPEPSVWREDDREG